jgi:hypothetical protein
MSEDRYDFFDDDWYDGAAIMTLRGRKKRLETMFNQPSHNNATQEENN